MSAGELFSPGGGVDLWAIASSTPGRTFGEYRATLGLDPMLAFHFLLLVQTLDH